jgi:hypothetical protein
MTPRATVLIVFVLVALVVPGVVGSAFAAPIPDYFEDEWVGFVCLTATPPGSPPISVLVQFNFDQVTFGGIPPNRANSLFTYLTSNLGLLSPIIGNNPQTTCSLTPSQTLAMFPGATALQAAQQVSGTFQQLSFARYIIVDAFLSFTVLYFGSVDTLRTEVYRVNGNNDLSYVASNEIAASLVP